MEKLYNLPAVKTTETKRLRDMFDKIETHVRGLKALGVATEQYDKLLRPLLQPNLPNDIQVDISQKCGSDAWNLKALLGALRTEIEARERCFENVIHTRILLQRRNVGYKGSHRQLLPFTPLKEYIIAI